MVGLLVWVGIATLTLPAALNLALIVGGVALTVPLAWLGRRALDRQPTADRVVWVTTLVHYGVLIPLGVALLRAVSTYPDWAGWTLPLPRALGWLLVLPTGAAALLAVANLAWKGWGAPFAIALSQKLSVEWLYAWTRNPMVLATLAFLVALGLWFQSALFVLWVLGVVAPALLVFVKVYEERELELRFGAAYRDYKARTPLLFPRRPRR
ncbi:MAG: isoprenylcysteine carboxylmethyltransferase family protein [Anaerolineales bacterium]|nr:isoprenylcysteine carboxylmethyltransferase family protein [Anaerolineales bacterium]